MTDADPTQVTKPSSRASRWPLAAVWAITVLVVVAFTATAWSVAPFRSFIGAAKRLVPIGLYAAVPIMLVSRSIARRRGRGASWGVKPWSARPRALASAPAGFCGSAAAFLVATFGSWDAGRSPSTLVGSIPVLDAAGYVGGAQRLLFEGTTDDFNGRRPLHGMFLAVRLALTGLDLRLALVMQALLLATACYIAARVVAHDLGAVAGVAVFAGLYAYTYPAAASALSEGMGATVGALAFAAVWVAVRERRLSFAFAGIALLTTAQGFRTSTVFLPVVLVFWFARFLRRSGRLDSRVLGVGMAAVVLGFSASIAASFIGGSHVDSLGGNGGYLLYGLARGVPSWDNTVGQQSWLTVGRDHSDEIERRSERERDKYVNELAKDELMHHPDRFTTTYLRSDDNYARLAGRGIVEPISNRAMQFVLVVGAILSAAVAVGSRWRDARRTALVDVALIVAALLAVPVLTQTWGDRPVFGWCGAALATSAVIGFGIIGTGRLPEGLTPHLHLTLVAFAVIVLELPIMGVDSTRVFASIAPFFALPLAFAVSVLCRRAAPPAASELVRTETGPRRAPIAIGCGLIGAALLGAPIAMAIVDKPRVEPHQCPDGRASEAIIGGVSTHLVDDPDEIDEASPSSYREGQAPRFLGDLPLNPPDLTVMTGLTLDGNDRLLLLRGRLEAPRNSVLYVCAEPVDAVFSVAFRRVWLEPVTFDAQSGEGLPK